MSGISKASSYISILLDMPLRDVEQIVYFNAYVVLAPAMQRHSITTTGEDQWLEVKTSFTQKSQRSWELKLASEQEALSRLQ